MSWDGETSLANAFALPSGYVIVTDRLVEIADSDDQIHAVILHEIGHIEHHHAMRQVMQTTIVSLLLIALTGDISAIDSWMVLMPTFLLESSYSRDHERDADQYAFERLSQNRNDPETLGLILQKIEADYGLIDQADSESDYDAWFKYLSSHPPTAERIEAAKAFAEQQQSSTE